MLKRTPLFSEHQRLGGRLVEFGGWEMPVQYTGIVDEHLTVRHAAGLFDISHMGQVFVTGPAALEFLNRALTNDLRNCPPGRGQYTLMCNDQGGVIDDLYVYCIEALDYILVVNASRVDADVAWLKARLATFPERQLVNLVNASDNRAAVAVQGPRVAQFIDQCFPGPSLAGKAVLAPTELKKNELASFRFDDSSLWLARTGYTGEDGFEVLTPAAVGVPVWRRLLAAGQAAGIKPCGLGARDTLRTEMCYPLYGHELDEQTTPVEAGLSVFVALEKPEFTGRTVLLGQKATGVKKKSVAFKMSEKSAPPRPGYPILDSSGAVRIGQVTSGTQSPSLSLGVGLGYVSPELGKSGVKVQIEIRGKPAPAEIVAKPIYRKS